MGTQEALQQLARDAQYDLSCACGTSSHDDHRKRGKDGTWMYPVTVPSGGTGIMLKTLMTNACSQDCRYCPLRNDQDYRRTALQPDKLARFFMDYKDRHNLFGLFLSSGVPENADRTMQRLIDTAVILRKRYQFRGYIHLKIIPGASDEAIRDAVSLASAVSLNIETPGETHYRKLSSRKNYLSDIITPLKTISSLTGKGSEYAKVSKTTQFIVGASDETDREILSYMKGLYQRLGINRVYFSSYQKGLGDPSIPGEQYRPVDPHELFTREHRLYQADFLVRKYGFAFDEFIFTDGSLPLDKDPKLVWAEAHPEFFPVRINSCTKQDLLRIPGIGPVLADRIVQTRKTGRITDLKKLRFPVHLAKQASKYIFY